MITGALALLSVFGVSLGTGGVLGGLIAWMATPGAGAARLALKIVARNVGKPLTPEKAAWLHEYNQLMRRYHTRDEEIALWNKYHKR